MPKCEGCRNHCGDYSDDLVYCWIREGVVEPRPKDPKICYHWGDDPLVVDAKIWEAWYQTQG